MSTPKITPLTKEEFCSYINLMRKTTEKEDKFVSVGQETFVEFFWMPNTFQSEVIELLGKLMNDQNDWIEYFIYELDYGKRWKEGTVIDADGSDIKLSTPEDLYDLLVSEWEK